jgi:hypothetical protein
MGPEAQCLTRALKAPTPHEPVTRLAEQARRSASRSRARRERRVLARVCRAAWRLEQAGRERAWALASALRRGSAIRTLAGAWLVRTARFAAITWRQIPEMSC